MGLGALALLTATQSRADMEDAAGRRRPRPTLSASEQKKRKKLMRIMFAVVLGLPIVLCLLSFIVTWLADKASSRRGGGGGGVPRKIPRPLGGRTPMTGRTATPMTGRAATMAMTGRAPARFR